MEAMRAYDVMTEERAAPELRLAPMPHPSHKRRIARNPLKLAKPRTMPKPVEEEEEKYDLYKSLRSAFAEVKLMMDGKLPKQTAQEFLEEFRKEKSDALRNSTNSGF